MPCRGAVLVFLSILLIPVAVLAEGTRTDEEVSEAALSKTLRTAYDAFKRDATLQELAERANANPKDRETVDALLRRMPLSPLEYLEIDMEVKHYEVAVPSFIQELHVRWIELNEPLARVLYGDERVDQVLSHWPADYGDDVTHVEALATVGTNRNIAATDSPAPNAYDGEIQIAVNHRNTNQMVAAANTWGTAGAACNNEETQSIFYSSNGGATWDYTCAPSNNVMGLGTCTATVFGSDPALYWNDNNEVFLNYMLLCSSTTTTKYSMVVARSADGGATWTKQGIIKNAWSTGTLEDKNFYAIDNTSTSPFYGRHYTCWDRSNNEKFAYSSNNGVTWTEVDLPAAGVGGIDLGCEIAVQKNGTVHVVWESLTCSSTCTDERMWYTKSTNGGASWSTPVQVHDHNLAAFSGANKPPVADQRGIAPFGAVDVDNSGGACDGTLYATFGDYTSGGATQTDVWVTRSTNGGTTWGAPVKVNDDGLTGRTQFHPFLQVDPSNGNVVVAWHDARNDANNRKVEIYAARSTNCGVSFETNVKVSQASAEFNNSAVSYTDENTTDNANRNPNQYGEYMGLDVKNGKAYLAWVDTRHFYPGSSTNAQKENVGFAVVDFCEPPPVPSGVTATVGSASQITVFWTASAGATSYNILRSTTNGGPYTLVGTSAATFFTDTGLSPNTTYYYVVQAVSSCTSGNSAQATAATNLWTLTVSRTGTGDGAVNSTTAGISCGTDCSETYPEGAVVILLATPSLGSVFGGWSGACSGTGSCVMTMDQARSVTATFSLSGLDFYTVLPCRVLDTRTNGSTLISGSPLLFQVAGTCGVPADAKAVSLNVTAVNATGNGNLRLYPGDGSVPTTSTLNFQAGVSRANNAIMSLATNGGGTLGAAAFLGAVDQTVDVLVDVNGYYK